MNPQDWEELAPLYALDALDGEELALFSEELKRSESLRALVNEYRDAATALPLSLEPVAPTPAVKARLMESVGGRRPRSAPVFTRLFWAAAAVVLITLIVSSLSTDMRELPIVRRPDAPAAEGMVRGSDRSVDFHITGLPACPPGKCYQLWHIGSDRIPVPQGTFHPDPAGVLCGSDALKHGLKPDDLLAFTMEPEGGSLKPTMPIYTLAKY